MFCQKFDAIIMIQTTTFNTQHITDTARKIGKGTDPKILEKALQAFYLLEQLQTNGLDLIFKGGTSLLLLLSPARRFSIDIDIITGEAHRIEPMLDQIISNTHFERWEPDNDRKHSPDAPVKHYKVFYKSAISQHFGLEPILLDVLLTPNPYPAINHKEINHPWLLLDGKPVTVQVPTTESIVGDKLTAFAPTTTGILYSKNRPVEIIKQLFDIAALFDHITDYGQVAQAYDRIVTEEIKFRKLTVSKAEVLEDTFTACHTIALRDAQSAAFQHLQTGINHITNFILARFKIEEAIISAAKVAVLAKWLLKGNDEKHPAIYKGASQLVDTLITDPAYTKLNKLKKSNPEAFFYWAQAVSL